MPDRNAAENTFKKVRDHIKKDEPEWLEAVDKLPLAKCGLR